jgi:hypothetical protein
LRELVREPHDHLMLSLLLGARHGHLQDGVEVDVVDGGQMHTLVSI